MTGDEFKALVDLVVDRFGRADTVWANPERFAADFRHIDGDAVFAAYADYCVDEHTDLRFPPTPPELLRRAARRLRRAADPTRRIEPGGESGDPELSMATWKERKGWKGLTWIEIVRQRHMEMYPDACPQARYCELHGGTPIAI